MRRIIYTAMIGLMALGSYGCSSKERVSYGEWDCKVQDYDVDDARIEEIIKAKNPNGCVMTLKTSLSGKRRVKMSSECEDFSLGDADLVFEKCRESTDQ